MTETQQTEQLPATTESELVDPPEPKKNLFPKIFWGTIYVMMGLTLGLLVLGIVASNNVDEAPSFTERLNQAVSRPPDTVEIESTVLRRYFSEASQFAYETAVIEIDPLLDELYAPVYAGITEYADFHYSIVGEYTELSSALVGQMGQSIESIMYKGYEERLEAIFTQLDTVYASAFRSSLNNLIESDLPPGVSVDSLGTLTNTAINDAISRAYVTVPVATAAASVGGFAMAKVVSKKIITKLVTKAATKTSAKVVAKGATSFFAGAGTGAAVGTLLGPVGTAVGGVVGGVATWFAADAAIISVDEYFNRDDFENELRLMVDENREELKHFLLEAMASKKVDMDDFTLRELSRQVES